ncbi:E3 ubiquitin-protein ligase COP1-like [Cydia strobilella]|uniref:E3 ubiquitin-protein ligase COP1-like n=1 Tax=Cydia strobilella TaxID=1100964 RepID=UPI003005EB17
MSGTAGSSSSAALGGLGGSLEDKDCELLCPVCFELIDEAYVTRCGHSFCYACIAKSVEQHRRCPKCGAAVASRDHMFPNFMLNELVARRRLRAARPPSQASEGGDAARLRALLAAESARLAMPDVELMLEVLTRRKRLLEAESAAAHHRLLYEFLAQLHRHRQQQLQQLAREAALVQTDMEHVAGTLRLHRHRQQQLQQLAREAALVQADMEHVAGTLRSSTVTSTPPSPVRVPCTAAPASSAASSNNSLGKRHLFKLTWSTWPARCGCTGIVSSSSNNSLVKRHLFKLTWSTWPARCGCTGIVSSSSNNSLVKRHLFKLTWSTWPARCGCTGIVSSKLQQLAREAALVQADMEHVAGTLRLHRHRQQQLQQLAREAALVQADMEHVAGTLRVSTVTILHRLLYEFLAQLHRHRQQQLQQLAREAALVQADMEDVAGTLRDLKAGAAGLASFPSEDGESGPASDAVRALRKELTELAGSVSDSAAAPPSPDDEEGFAGAAGENPLHNSTFNRWRRLVAHFEDFVQCYFAHRADELYFPAPAGTPAPLVTSAPSFTTVASVTTVAGHDDQVPDNDPTSKNTNFPAPAVTRAPLVTSAPSFTTVASVTTVAGHDDQVPDNDPTTAIKPSFVNGDQRLPESSPTEAPRAPPAPSPSATLSKGEGGGGGLDAFREDLVAFTRYRALRPLATLSYSSDAINYSTIVSTIEFDKDEEFFAIAGVTKRIKVFEYEAVVRDAVDVHYPCAEMQCAHKISCVSWNAYHKNVLASADYEGTVAVWDAGTGQRTRALLEHDKRCWSVHFNRADVRLLASGSDDARVKLWALNAERSVATLEARFNVCCVRFNPRSSCHLAFGSADHCVHYYDLRAPRAPLAVFRDHRKAVSYVKFLDARTLVSASTDSQLKLWKVESPRCVRSFTGHANEKNFVGLATEASGRYVACGSENNALYVYYAGLSKPLLAHRFDAVRGFLERGTGGERREDEPSEFVSAVCWRRAPPSERQVLLAANSQGTIKVLELV